MPPPVEPGAGGTPLRADTLGQLPAHVITPRYERGSVIAGIAHVGVGAFHRAHLGVYMERCLGDTDQREWGILGINLLPRDALLAEALRAQDCLYTVTELDPNGACATRVVGAMVDHVHAPAGSAALVSRLAAPAIRIVSLTITEGGYPVDARGGLRRDDPLVTHDLAHPQAPRSAFGLITAALAQRRVDGTDPFAVISCDNIAHNGAHARRACLAFARARDEGLAAWIEAEVDFPNSMVDRITPAMTEERLRSIGALTGVRDQAPVVCEDYIQWVLEDRFRHGRPAWDRHGVALVADVAPYEEAKLRLLNGAHQMLSFPARLAGVRRVDEAVADPAFAAYLRDFLACDAIPGLKPPPGFDLEHYAETVLRRFGNAAIADQVERLCLDGGSKIPVFLLPTLSDCLARGRDARRFAFVLACYDRILRVRRDDQGRPLSLDEPNAMQRLLPIIQADSPLALLRCAELVGSEAGQDRRFVRQYLALAGQLEQQGTRATLAALGTLD